MIDLVLPIGSFCFSAFAMWYFLRMAYKRGVEWGEANTYDVLIEATVNCEKTWPGGETWIRVTQRDNGPHVIVRTEQEGKGDRIQYKMTGKGRGVKL